MTMFICEYCGFEMDYNEDPNEMVDCEECGGVMVGVED